MTTRKKNWLVSSVLRTARWIYPIANVDRDNTVVTIKLKTSAAPMFVVTNAIVSVHGDVAFERGDVDGVASVIALSASSAICVRHPVVCVALAMDPIVVMRDEFVACSGSIVGVTKESVTVSGDGSTCWLIGGHNNNGPLLTGDVLLYTPPRPTSTSRKTRMTPPSTSQKTQPLPSTSRKTRMTPPSTSQQTQPTSQKNPSCGKLPSSTSQKKTLPQQTTKQKTQPLPSTKQKTPPPPSTSRH